MGEGVGAGLLAKDNAGGGGGGSVGVGVAAGACRGGDEGALN